MGLIWFDKTFQEVKMVACMRAIIFIDSQNMIAKVGHKVALRYWKDVP